jgi:hypothetical protein
MQAGEKMLITVGYDSKLETATRKDGEEWTDSQGKNWVRKNGYNQRVSNYKENLFENRCKICNLDLKWGNEKDRLIYNKTGNCNDCNITFESILKIKGLYQSYEKNKIHNNELSEKTYFKKCIEESINYLSNTPDNKLNFYNEDASYETWTDDTNSYEKILVDLKKDLLLVTEDITKLQNIIKELNYNKSLEEDVIKLTKIKINGVTDTDECSENCDCSCER